MSKPSDRNIIEDWPPFYFRPSLFREEWDIGEDGSPYTLLTGQDKRIVDVFRYDEKTDQVIPDDGKPGLAFGVRSNSGNRGLYYAVPHYDNILYKWSDIDGNRHHMTRNGERGRGDGYRDRNSHPNVIAERAISDRRGLDWWSGSLNGENFDPTLITVARECYNVEDQTIMTNAEKQAIRQNCTDCKNDSYGHRFKDWEERHFILHSALEKSRYQLKELKQKVAEKEELIEALQAASEQSMNEIPGLEGLNEDGFES